MYLLWFCVLIVLGVWWIYKWAVKNDDFFVKNGVKHLKPVLFVGNFGAVFLGKSTFGEFFLQAYNKFPHEKVIGFFDFVSPSYMVRDPELVKQIGIKAFDHFVDHPAVIDHDVDGDGLIVLTGQKWRDMRSTLSPAFTASKMRQMFQLIVVCSTQMVDHFNGLNLSEQQHEMKDIFSRTMTDIIATCAFGVPIDSFRESDNRFYRLSQKVLNLSSPIQVGKFVVMRFFPKLAVLFKMRTLPASLFKFFQSLFVDAVEYRTKNNIKRPDMIQLLAQAKQGELKHETEQSVAEGFSTVVESKVGHAKSKRSWTDDELVEQCMLFFSAGFETSSTLLSFTAAELAVNPDIQKRLFDEIRDVQQTLGAGRVEVTYDVVQKMNYMDMVVSETLRKWPPALGTDRICAKDFDLQLDDTRTITIRAGDKIVFPIYALHMAAEHFPNPEQYDPERFSDDNKSSIETGAYIPFGIGPRNCIGSRFALMSVKCILFYLLLNFELVVNDKTILPLKMGPLNTMPKSGINLTLRKRSA